ncbi:mitochondrial carrier domain-containing protein [Phycomyces nitens]|nr:mitochondrial carrier domain-containing protein [Phycomyces nitens]
MTTQENTIHTTSSTEKLLSACTGALLTSLLVTPMDVVKLRLQTQHYDSSRKTKCCSPFSPKNGLKICTLTSGIQHYSKIFSKKSTRQVASIHECAIELPNRPFAPKNPQMLKGTLDGFHTIVKNEGLTALWRGLSPALLMSVPANVIYFVGYDYLKVIIQPYTSTKHNDYSPLVAGGLARTVAVALISPIELFRTRLQAATGVNDFRNVLYGVQNMMKKDGVRALWRGLPPTLWRDVPFSAMYWMTYEKTKHALMAYTNKSSVTMAQGDLYISFIAGAFSGMCAAAITTPFDVAKTRRQVDSGKDSTSMKSVKVPAILKQIYIQDGIQGLFRGITPRVAKVAPSCAIMISSYEIGKTFFAKQHQTTL